jgi:hypothetical protein
MNFPYDDDEDMTNEEYGRMIEECRDMEEVRANAMAAAIKNNPCHHFDYLGDFIVGRHVTVVEIIDEAGGTHLYPIPSANLSSWEAEGLLRAALR